MSRKKHKLHVRNRQRQKMSRRTIIVLAASFLVLAGVGLTVFLQLSQPEQSRANLSDDNRNIRYVEDQEFLNDRDIPELKIAAATAGSSQAILVRKLKPATTAASSSR